MGDPRKVLLVAGASCGEALAGELAARGWQPVPCDGLAAAVPLLRQHRFEVALLVLDSSHPEAARQFDACAQAAPACEWVGVFPPGQGAAPPWRDLILAHFFDYHTYPADLNFLCRSLGHAHGRAALRRGPQDGAPPQAEFGMVGASETLESLRSQLRKAGPTDAPVLIGGESGSGKELVAHALHKCSRRAHGPFVPVNCGALAPTLIHSELFGHERGSFSGASAMRRGLIEMARGGTLFLDEVAELPLDLQATLLRFLQDKTIVRVGSTQATEADVRVIAASHVDLAEASAAGRFRQDLFFRLSVLVLTVPPLRERPEDIAPLARHFHAMFAQGRPGAARGFSTQAMAAMARHSWPGNVRELHNRVQRAVVMAEHRLIGPADLGLAPASGAGEDLEAVRTQAEKSAIRQALERVSHNVTLAARELGVSRMTLYRLMAKHQITPNAT